MTAKPLRTVLPNKPELVVHAADLTVTARALASLLKAKSPNVFEHNGAPAILVPAAGNGATMIRPLTCNEIIIEAHKLCQPVKHKDGGRQEVTLLDKIAELYLAMSGDWELRPLTGISTAPILRHDGSIRWEQGYDEHSGLFCDCDLPALSLPDRPSRDDAERALATLRRPFRTHAFADRQTVSEVMLNGKPTTVEAVDLSTSPGKDESAFLVALLTAVARPSLPLAPAVVLRAPAISGAGTGKGLLARALAVIAFGQQPHAAALGDGKEFEKGLTAELLRADPSILIDNVNRRELRSPVLCTSLSERPAMLRVLGVSEMRPTNPTAFIAITGNALAIAEDLVRRVITIDIDAKCENPEQRKFAGNFLDDIAKRRAELLAAALCIWRFGRQNAATLKRGQPLGGFEQWADWCRDPLLTLGCADPVARMSDLKSADPDRIRTVEIFTAWWKHHQAKPVKARELHDDVQALIVPDVKKRSRQNVVDKVAKLAGTQVGGFRLTSDKDAKEKGDKGRWTVLSYQLVQVSQDETTSDEDATSDSGAQAAAEGAAAHGEAEAHACAHCGRADGVIYQMHDIRFFDPLKPPSNPPSVYLHEACTPPFFARSNRQARQAEPPSGSVPAAAMAKPAEEGTTVSVPFMITLAQKAQLRARGFSDEQIANLNAQQAHDILGQAEASAPKPAATQQSEPAKPADMPPPSDPVEHLRASGARLDASREPCAGYRPGDWPRVHRVIAAFLAGPFAKLAVDVGWTELELVGVHPEVGVARPDACGALLTNAYGSPVTQVTPQLIRFANGLAVYKARLSVGNSVAVWDYRESAVGERQQLARTPISESVTDSAEGEPGLEQPCAARRGRVQEKDGVFLHFCVECGRFGPYGYGVRLRAGQLGRWYCREHRPQAHEP